MHAEGFGHLKAKSQSAAGQTCSSAGGLQHQSKGALQVIMLIWCARVCVCLYDKPPFAPLLNTPLVASDLVLLASLATPRSKPGTSSCTRLPDLQCRSYPQDQVALLQRTPMISSKPLRVYSRSPPPFWLFFQQPSVRLSPRIALITTFNWRRLTRVTESESAALVFIFLQPALQGNNLQPARVSA